MRRWWAGLAAAAMAVTVLWGCSEPQTPPSAQGGGTVSEAAPGSGGAPPAAPAGGSDSEPNVTLAQAVLLAPQQDPTMKPLSDAYNKAAAAMKKSANDSGARAAYDKATYQFAHAVEYQASLSPRVKYRAALELYRRALKVDPGDTASKKEMETIENIYRTIPGGIPQG